MAPEEGEERPLEVALGDPGADGALVEDRPEGSDASAAVGRRDQLAENAPVGAGLDLGLLERVTQRVGTQDRGEVQERALDGRDRDAVDDRDLVRRQRHAMEPHTGRSPPARRPRDVDQCRRAAPDPAQVRRGGMTERGIRTAREHEAEQLRLRAQRAMTHRVDPVVHLVQGAGPDPVPQRSPPDAQLGELRTRDQTVLALGDRRHTRIRTYVVRIVDLDAHTPIVPTEVSHGGDAALQLSTRHDPVLQRPQREDRALLVLRERLEAE